MTMDTKNGSGRTTGRGIGLVAVRGLALALISLPGAVLCFCLSLVSIALIPIGVGIVTTPYVLTGVRAFAHARRVLAAEWGGVRIPPAYRPLPEDANPWACTFGMLRDPATWRDLRWLPVDMTAGFVTALLPAVLLLYPLEGFALALGLWRVFPDGYWYGFVPVTGQASAFGAAALGLVLLFLAHVLTPRVLGVHFRLTRAVLGSDQGELAERVRLLDEQTPPGGVPRPAVWGGYRVVPDRVEFWQGGADRLHDRLRFVRDESEGGGWLVQRLAP